MFESEYNELSHLFENYLQDYLQKEEASFSSYFSQQLEEYKILKNTLNLNLELTENYSQKIKTFFCSPKYSLTGEAKRFRPVLALSVSKALGKNPNEVLPFALCVEMIHAYSLIHDDLPCMDNDDFRRGKPTNHKAFGESTALLAGDALLTEAFGVLLNLNCEPTVLKKIYAIVVECAGIRGMIGGQYFDLESQKTKVEIEALTQMQINKTGALIYAAATGAALLCEANSEQLNGIKKFARLLGLSFQIADDLLDKEKNELGSFVSLIGLEKARKVLMQISELLTLCLESIQKNDFLLELAQYNLKRKK